MTDTTAAPSDTSVASEQMSTPQDAPTPVQEQVDPLADLKKFSLGDDFVNSLPDNYKSVINNYNNSPVAMVEALIEMRTALSRRPENFTHDDWKAFMKANEQINNIPAEPRNYKYEFNADPASNLHNNFLKSEEDLSAIKHLAFDMNIDQEQAQKMFNAFNRYMNYSHSTALNSLQSIKNASIESLKAQWGDKSERNFNNVGKSTSVIAEIINEEGIDAKVVSEEMSQLNLDASPIMMKLLAKLGDRVAEGQRKGYSTVPGTRATAVMEYNNFKADPSVQKVLGNKMHPDHRMMKDKLDLLSKRSFGEI